MEPNQSHTIGNAPLSVGEAYDHWHAKYSVDAESDTPWHRLVKKNMDGERDISGKRILEIGCGRGGFAFWLASREPRPAAIFAADFSEVAIGKAAAFAAESGTSGVSWQVQDIQSLAFPTGSFDTVVSCETIEHVPKPRLAITQLSRVLKPGGRLFLTFPNYLGPMGAFRIYRRLTGRRYTEEGQPINQFLLSPLVRHWASRAGLAIEHIEGVGHALPFPRKPYGIPLPMDRPQVITKWLAQHSLIVARKRAPRDNARR